MTSEAACAAFLAASLLFAVSLGAETQVFRLGDPDGFGLLLGEGDARLATAGFFDNRGPGDPEFTDVRPVRPGNPGAFAYEHRFTRPSGPVTRATLRLFTLGLQDGDSEVSGVDFDTRLFVDGEELQGAFDTVDQFRVAGEQLFEIAGLVSVDIPERLLDQLDDGVVVLRFVNIDLLRPLTGDAFAIDYSELALETAEGFQRPGDCNQDGAVNLADALCSAGFLFLAEPAELPCGNGGADDPANIGLLDFDGDGTLDLPDSVALLRYVFLGATPHALGTRCLPIQGCADRCAANN